MFYDWKVNSLSIERVKNEIGERFNVQMSKRLMSHCNYYPHDFGTNATVIDETVHEIRPFVSYFQHLVSINLGHEDFH